MSGIAAYKELSVVTQDRGRIVVLLYEGAIKNIKLAIEAMTTGDYAKKGMYVTKALDIIFELNCSLDVESGGEIAQNLRKLYSFMTRHLNMASLKKDTQMMNDVIKVLEELMSGWKAIA